MHHRFNSVVDGLTRAGVRGLVLGIISNLFPIDSTLLPFRRAVSGFGFLSPDTSIVGTVTDGFRFAAARRLHEIGDPHDVSSLTIHIMEFSRLVMASDE